MFIHVHRAGYDGEAVRITFTEQTSRINVFTQVSSAGYGGEAVSSLFTQQTSKMKVLHRFPVQDIMEKQYFLTKHHQQHHRIISKKTKILFPNTLNRLMT